MEKNSLNEELLKKLPEKSMNFIKEVEKNPLLFVCPLHTTNPQNIKRLREDLSWRGLARATSEGKCTNQICGWFLCIYAGIDKGPWEDTL